MTKYLFALLSYTMLSYAISAVTIADELMITVQVLSKHHPQQVRIETHSRIFHFHLGDTQEFEFTAEPDIDIKITVNEDVSRIYRGGIKLHWQKNEFKIFNITPIEKYVAGVVVGELGANAPTELVKAQAILARTYARKVSAREQLSDLAYHQVFTGFDHYASKIYSQTVLTTGQYLLHNRQLADALFHAQCGSAIYSAGQFWQSDQSFDPIPFPTGFKTGDPWSVELTRDQLRAVFLEAGPMQRISGRPEQIRIGSERFVIEQFRLKVNREYGWNTLPSNEFSIETTNNGYRFTGRGLGHLVGLCQQQAKRLANSGWNAAQILQIFYPETHIDAL